MDESNQVNNHKNWIEWIRKLPSWVKGAIGLATLVIGFIALFKENPFLSITVSIVLIFASSFCLSMYIAFSKKKSEILGGGYTYRFPSYRPLALATIVLIFAFSIILIALQPSRSFITTAFTGSATPKIPLLNSPRILDVNVESSTSMGSLQTLCGVDSQAGLPSGNLPTPNKNGLICTTIYQGKSENISNLIFDLILTNNSNSQKTLIKFEKSWCYYLGGASSTGSVDVLQPVAEYIIIMPIDMLAFVESGTDIIYPPIVIPPRSDNGPSKTSIRVQLYHHFVEPERRHPNSDWDIYFNLNIVEDTGEQTVVFFNQSWKRLAYTSDK